MAKGAEGELRQKKAKQERPGKEAKDRAKNGAKNEAENEAKEKSSIPHLIGNIVGIILCAILLPFVIVNMTLVIKSYVYPDKVPTFLGVAPMIVTSGSMHPNIKLDDLVFTREVKQETLKERDVIAYLAKPEGPVITHRIVEISATREGEVFYYCQGDANNTPDQDPVFWGQVIGKFWFRIEGAGYYALFMKEPIGMVIFVGIPLALFVIYDAIRRALYARKMKKEQAALLAAQAPAEEPPERGAEAEESFAAASETDMDFMEDVENAFGPPEPPEALREAEEAEAAEEE